MATTDMLSRSPKDGLSILSGWPQSRYPSHPAPPTSAGAARADTFEFLQRASPAVGARAADAAHSSAGSCRAVDHLFKCPICLEVMEETSRTPCDHMFCMVCISEAVKEKPVCPICATATTKMQLRMCTDLDQLIQHRSAACIADRLRAYTSVAELCSSDVTELLDIVKRESKKEGEKPRMGGEDEEAHEDTVHFLLLVKQEKLKQMKKLQRELQAINSDLQLLTGCKEADVQLGKRTIDSVGGEGEVVQNKRRRIARHLPDLDTAYSELREDDMDYFSGIVSSVAKYTQLRPVASIRYDDILRQSSTIISSIQFSGDQECFATAGVNCKIKIFNFGSVVHDQVDASVHTNGVYTHFPMQELNSRSKISCLSWNPDVLQQLASTDADGVVTLWDAHVGESIRTFHEHSQRAWSVDFSGHGDRGLFATGSDDCTVKMWSPSSARSVHTLECKANVCAVKFNPYQPHYVAFGCADRLVHYYDLRNPSMPMFMLKDHKKAVSYVDFFPNGELMSSSTDSTLKLWDIDSAVQDHRIRTFAGHKNVRNFVGMSAASRDFVVCGSEDDRLYVYHKELARPVATHSFSSQSPKERGSQSPFITSVCWRKKHSNTIIGANSNGIVNILELV